MYVIIFLSLGYKVKIIEKQGRTCNIVHFDYSAPRQLICLKVILCRLEYKLMAYYKNDHLDTTQISGAKGLLKIVNL